MTPASSLLCCGGRFQSRVITLSGFFPPPHGSEDDTTSHLLCPVRALSCYLTPFAAPVYALQGAVQRTSPVGAAPVSLTLEVISQAYMSAGESPPDGMGALHKRRLVLCGVARWDDGGRHPHGGSLVVPVLFCPLLETFLRDFGPF